jgi:hypothetical protein
MTILTDAPEGATVTVGGGGQFVVSGVTWELGAPSGDRMGAILRDGSPVGALRAARLVWRDGQVLAQHVTGGWFRLAGSALFPVADADAEGRPTAAAAARPASATPGAPLCEAPGCDDTATRVIDGHDMCSGHRSLQPDVEMVRCKVDGCGCAAQGYGNAPAYCLHHQTFGSQRR